MDLPEKGAHCALETCQIFDLLPIKCPSCQALYCKLHAQRDQHGCAVPIESVPSTIVERVECALQGCTKGALEGTRCEACHGVYCVEHRYGDAHACVPIAPVEQKDKKAEAQALLSKLFPDVKKAGGSTPRAKPTDPAKAAKLRAIEVMRMKHKAVAADPAHARGSVQPENKVYLRVLAENKNEVLWFVKTAITGRAVDLAANALKVSRADGRAMVFVRETDELRNDLELGGQVQDGDEVQLVKSG